MRVLLRRLVTWICARIFIINQSGITWVKFFSLGVGLIPFFYLLKTIVIMVNMCLSWECCCVWVAFLLVQVSMYFFMFLDMDVWLPQERDCLCWSTMMWSMNFVGMWWCRRRLSSAISSGGRVSLRSLRILPGLYNRMYGSRWGNALWTARVVCALMQGTWIVTCALWA